ncbi:MAG: pyridoxal phosphate-dependent aminotransferase [Candidatus Omnitrophota bacterium]
MRFSEKIMAVEPSATLEITAKAKVMLASGEDVITLAAGEPDFDTPGSIKDAAVKAIREGNTKYTPAGGTRSLKDAICRKFNRDNALNYDVDEVVVSCGAKHSLYNILQVILRPGDEVILIAPYWLSYPEMVKLGGGVPKILATDAGKGFKAGVKDIKAAFTDKTRALIINSPSNPAGVVYSEKELRAIAEASLAAGITIISDEIYEKVIFDGQKHFSIAAASDAARASTIVVNGVSKSFAMTGWRIGYAAGDRKIMKMVTTLQSHSTSGPCSISQAAAEHALSAALEDEMERNRIEYQLRRDVLMKNLSGETKLRLSKPEGAFYLFCDISGSGMDSMTFCQKLLEEKKSRRDTGDAFRE